MCWDIINRTFKDQRKKIHSLQRQIRRKNSRISKLKYVLAKYKGVHFSSDDDEI